jgi:succinate dehydrogenase / fumarate reductase membrane anchor subunit
VKKTIAGSHSGTGWWLAQRISALVLLVAGSGLLLGFWFSYPFNYPEWHSAFQQTFVRLLVWLVVASLCLHAWIGLRDVLMDYVKPLGVRLLLNVLVTLTLVLCVVWATAILWGGNGHANI